MAATSGSTRARLGSVSGRQYSSRNSLSPHRRSHMKHLLFALLATALIVPATAVAKKATKPAKPPSIVIPKPLPAYPLQPLAALAVVAPPLLVYYDLQRRVQCLDPPDPLGLGGPGFDGKPTPASGGVMVPC